MASAKRTHEVLNAIRRNTCYNSSRTILLISSVVLALLALVAGTSLFTLLDKENPMATLLSASVVVGGALLAFLANYLGNVFLDGADALLQIAKFEERGQRSRTEALELARNATVEEEETLHESPPVEEAVSKSATSEDEQVEEDSDDEESKPD